MSVPANVTGHWRQMLKRIDDLELYQLEEQIDAVISLPGWERILAFISQGREGVLRSLTSGPTRSHEDYARQVGYLGGLEEAPSVVKAIKEAAAERRKTTEARLIADQAARDEGIQQ
jgi:hypothetical protein